MTRKTPRAIADLNGSSKRHPRPPEAINQHGIGEAPAHFTIPERRMWDELVSESPPGTLTRADRKVLEQLTILYTRFRTSQYSCDLEFPPALHNQMTRLLGQLGMVPSMRLPAPRGAAPDNPFNGF